MHTNSVKEALKAGKVQIGCQFGQFRSPEIVRLLKAAGFNWCFVDMEHGGFDIETVQDICRVSYLIDFVPVVRVADLRYDLVARSLDCGARGIVFPRVESPELLEQAVSWAKFPPVGVRGFGLAPPQANYESVTFPDVMSYMNENGLIILQIETVRAFEAREELLSVKGIDAVLVGPADLSISLGVPGEMENPKLIETVEAIRDSCLRHGVAPGIHNRSVQMARFWRDRGMHLIGCNSEVGFLWERAKEVAAALI
jgi:2-dehydro-3-deoxyglucarate aldolase/4-hydroxy-2-oxoheptanedioate aldolase